MLKDFRLTRTVIVVAALVLLVISIALFVAAAEFDDQELLLQSIASALLSVAVVSLVSELVIRDAFLKELLELVGLEENVRSEGLRSLAVGTTFDVGSLVAEAWKIRVVLQDPTHFESKDWQRIIRRAGEGRLEIEVFVPDSSSASLPVLAASLGMEPDALRQRVDAASGAIEKLWRSAASQSRLRIDSTLKIFPVEPFPSFSMAQINDDRCIFHFPPMFYGPTPREGLLLDLTTSGRHSLSGEWVRDRMVDLSQQVGVPKYSSGGGDPAAQAVERGHATATAPSSDVTEGTPE